MNKKRAIIITAAVAVAVTVAVVSVDERIKVRKETVYSDKVDAPVKLLLLSDHHSSKYGDEQRDLIKAIDKLSPDAILMTGDIFDNRVNNDNTITLLENIASRYDCFFVSGNHEVSTNSLKRIKKYLRELGVTVLEGENTLVEINRQQIIIGGIDDPLSFPDAKGRLWEDQLEECDLGLSDEYFSVLMTHRPERVDDYRETGYDLVLAGHAHGGQVIIPGIVNGLYAPNQGFFPKYAGGRYELNDTQTMIVSRGLSKYLRPRVFNRPELVLVTIKPEK
jgi:predicted MPP superfamily phosphohydrolase